VIVSRPSLDFGGDAHIHRDCLRDAAAFSISAAVLLAIPRARRRIITSRLPAANRRALARPIPK